MTTVKDHAHARITDAFEWVFTAHRDLRRNDRVDALDSLRMARQHIDEAEQAITKTLPEVMQ